MRFVALAFVCWLLTAQENQPAPKPEVIKLRAQPRNRLRLVGPSPAPLARDPDQYMIHLKVGARPVFLQKVPRLKILRYDKIGNFVVVQLEPSFTDEALKALSERPEVFLIEQEALLSNPISAPNDASYGVGNNSWNHTNLNALSGWTAFPFSSYLTASAAAAAYASRVRIVVGDTGVDCAHEDYINSGGSSADSALGGQIDYANSFLVAGVAVPSGVTCNQSFADEYGHGTTTIGTIVAAANNGVGSAGLAWPYQVIVGKLSGVTGLSSQSNSFAVLARAKTYNGTLSASGQVRVAGTITQGAYSEFVSIYAKKLYAADIIPMIPTGNSGWDSSQNLSNAFSCGFTVQGIGAYAIDGSRLYNYGPCETFTMPGETVLGPQLGGGYRQVSGTSLASPQAFAVGALIAGRYPDGTAAAWIQALQRSAVNVDGSHTGGGWSSSWGYGRMDILAAVNNTVRSGMTYGRAVLYPVSAGNPVTALSFVLDGGTGSQQTVSSVSGMAVRYVPLPAGWHTVQISGTLDVERFYVVPGADTYLELQYSTSGQVISKLKGTVTKSGQPVPYALVQAQCTSGCSAAITNTYTSTDWFVTRPASDTGEFELPVWSGGTYNLRVSTLSGQATVTARIVASTTTVEDIALALIDNPRPAQIRSTY